MRQIRLVILFGLAVVQTIALAAAQNKPRPELRRPEKRAETSEKAGQWTRESSKEVAKRDRPSDNVDRKTTDRDERASSRRILDKASAWDGNRGRTNTDRSLYTEAGKKDSNREERSSGGKVDKESRWDQRKPRDGQSEKSRRAAVLDHIFHGEIKKGSAQGFHYEGAQMETAYGTKVIESTRTAPDSKGIYQAKVMVRGIEKKERSTFFPRAWSRADVTKAINEAYAKRANVPTKAPNYFEGVTSNNIVIGMYCNKNGALVTAFPLKDR
jgi:hypothetical protein